MQKPEPMISSFMSSKLPSHTKKPENTKIPNPIYPRRLNTLTNLAAQNILKISEKIQKTQTDIKRQEN